MKICLVGLAFPFRGGIAHYTTMLYRALASRHEVALITLKRQYPGIFFPGTTQYDHGAESMKVDDTPIIDTLNPFTWLRAGVKIRSFAPDMTLFQWWMPFFGPSFGSIALFLRLFSRGRICFLCHNVKPHQRTPLDRLFSWYGLRFADTFIVHSDEDMANLLKMRPGVRARKNPHPTYDFFAADGKPSQPDARKNLGLDGPVILFFGFIKPYKGLMDLINAMPEIKKKTGAILLVVGEFYEDRILYDNAVARLGLEDNVRFVDKYVPNNEVPLYFSAADVAVLPYRSATQSGIVQIAFGMGLPCIVTRVGGLPEVVKDGVTGFTVPPNDPRALADAVTRFYEENSTQIMKKNIAEQASQFSWDRIIDVIEDLEGVGP
ncbi:glycosyltransferase [Acidobacteriota bacterium]